MKFLEARMEKGRRVVRLFGIKVRKSAAEPTLSEQAAMLRRELLAVSDIGAAPPARGVARDVQLCGVVLLREILRVAEENGFHPWTISGSLLGTVRHGGRFVPWDDDADQGMLRGEYSRFCEVFNEKCRDGFRAWRRYSRKWNQIKVSHRELPPDVTASVMSYDLYFRPLPTLAEKHALFMKVRAEQERLASLWTPHSTDAERFAALEDSRERVILEGRGSAAPEAAPAVFRGLEFMTPDWVKEAVYDYSDIFPLKSAEFEGLRVAVPNDPEAVLTYNYGDWASWPGRLRPHHNASRFDMEKALAMRRFLRRHGEGLV